MTPAPTLTLPNIDILSLVQPFVTWGLPIIATLFAIGWGIKLVFGKRR
jgi:hypothetical protein